MVAAAEEKQAEVKEVRMRKPPQPTGDRMPNGTAGAMMTAAAGVEGVRVGGVITDRMDLANAMKKTADRWGRIAKHEGGVEQRILIANATYPFPEDRKLHASDWQANSHKIEKVIPTGIPGLAWHVADGVWWFVCSVGADLFDAELRVDGPPCAGRAAGVRR